MKKLLKRIGICLVLAASVWCGSLLADRQRLNDELIRFHVVANSDSEEDQSIKLQVRDAVLASLESDLNKIADVNEARAYLQAKLPQIQAVANSVLEATGCDCVRKPLIPATMTPLPCPPVSTKPCGSPSARERGITGGAWHFPACA